MIKSKREDRSRSNIASVTDHADFSSIIQVSIFFSFFFENFSSVRERERELFFGSRSAVIRACLSTRRKRNDDYACRGGGLGESFYSREKAAMTPGDDAAIEENDEIERKSPE